jgi:Holliday junction resolvase RusA-like endonuclease
MTTIYLPYPPTVNKLYAGYGKRHNSKDYKAWIKLASATKKGDINAKMITTECECVISVVRPDKRVRDVANLEKAVTDFMVKSGYLKDDSLIVRNTQQWATGNYECKVELIPHSIFTPASDYLKKIVVRPV